MLENFAVEGDRANAKPYKHTDDCSTKSDWDSAELVGLVWGEGQLAIIIQKRSQCSTVTASVCRKSQAEMLGFFIDMWYNKYGDERC